MILDQTAEISRLRTLLRDLLALATVGDAWVGKDPAAIAAELADVLIQSLQLDFAFVRLCDSRGCHPVEAVRGESWPGFADWLQRRVIAVGGIARKEVVANINGMQNSGRGFIIPVGADAERGIVAAACDRSDFPNETDQQLLSMAANNAATAFHNACLISELRTVEEALRNNELELRSAQEKLEIKVAERTAELHRSERELRTLIEVIPSYVGTSLPDGTVDFLSKSWLDYFGQTREEALGWGWAGVVHPDDVDRVLADLQTGLASGEPVEQELRCRRADGVYHWFLNRSRPLRNEEGKIVKWYWILLDVNALKETEHALRVREHELLGIIETIPSMLWSASPAGETTHLSQRFLEYCGLPLEELVNRGWERCIHPDDREETAKAFERAISSGESYSAMHRVRRADGAYRWHHSMGAPLRDPDGVIIQWYGLATDIDERKRAEDHLRDTRIKLAKASRLATVAELAGSIAHELNQPLMSVLANAQAAKRWLSTAPSNVMEANSSIERIIRDARAADETMQHIRALFKQESFEKMDANIADILYEVVRVVQEDPKKRHVPIECRFEEPPPFAHVDQIQIQQVFINLIVNAIEALEGHQGDPQIVVRAATDPSRMLIQVTDNGPGVNDLNQIFDAFVTTKENGMGIGLAVSRTIVEAHGGQLWAENNKGGGATFNVALPLSQTDLATT